jgi:exosome complex RNA-binding protein Rrp42 (RNase PH superfamily)
MEAFRKIYPGEFYRKFLSHKVRPDDRALMGLRKISISVGTIMAARL